MAISEDEVRHVASLARLSITDTEVKEYTKQLEDVLGYIAVLESVDVEGTEPTNQVTGLTNVFREDETRDSTPEELERLFANAPEMIDGHVAVPHAIKKFK